MKNLFRRAIIIGQNAENEPWMNLLIQKINTLCYIAMMNMILAFIILELFHYPNFRYECIVAIFLIPVSILLNHNRFYFSAIYCYFILNFLLMGVINLKMGLFSFSILYYLPMFISIIQILGSKEILKHLTTISVLYLLSIFMVLVSFRFDLLKNYQTINVTENIVFLNIFLSFTTAIVLSILLVKEFILQGENLKILLKEKEILLAEVFHRVKNNLNIVTSLLSLKKNSSDNLEAQKALEDCRNRVYSMALVHENIFNKQNVVALNFNDYIHDLSLEIARSLGEQGRYQIHYDTENIELELSNAVPCGLILNELITNAFKYAQTSDRILEITIRLKQTSSMIELSVKDNGPGFKTDKAFSNETLGFELIRSLVDQINGSYKLENKNGFLFVLNFQQDI